MKRPRPADEALPEALDLLACCLRAGLSVEASLRTIAPEVPGALGAALAEGVSALDAGLPRSRAYEAVAPAGDETARACRVLARAERLGAGVADALDGFAADLRARARSAAEARARVASVRLAFPLTLCFLPAFVLLAVAPVVVAALDGLRGL